MAARPGEPHDRAQLEDVVDGREQVGRSSDPHRGEPGQRLVARRLDPDPALDVRPGGEGVERRRVGRAAGGAASTRPAAGGGRSRRSRLHVPGQRLDRGDRRQGLPLGEGQDELRDRFGRTGSAELARRPRPSRTGWASSARMSAAASSASASKSSSATIRAAPASARTCAFARWWPAACGIRDDDHRHPEGRDLGQGRRAGPARRRGRRPRAPPACRRAGTGTAGSGSRASAGSCSRAASAAAYPLSPVTWSTWTRSTSRGSASTTAALNRRTAWEPPKIRSVGASAGRRSRARAAARSIAATSRIGVPVR